MKSSVLGSALAAERERDKDTDLRTLYLRDRHGVPLEWDWFEASSAPGDVPQGFLWVRGAVAPRKRNGNRNWRKRDRSTESSFFIETADYERWRDARAVRFDECWRCRGTGQEFHGWSRDKGVEYRPCAGCKTTGRP